MHPIRSRSRARDWLFLVNFFFELSGSHLAATHMAGDQYAAQRAERVREGECRRLCVVVEQALAATEVRRDKSEGEVRPPARLQAAGASYRRYPRPSRLAPSWCLRARIALVRSPFSA